jgi:hypothetical protein
VVSFSPSARARRGTGGDGNTCHPPQQETEIAAERSAGEPTSWMNARTDLRVAYSGGLRRKNARAPQLLNLTGINHKHLGSVALRTTLQRSYEANLALDLEEVPHLAWTTSHETHRQSLHE